MSMTLVRVHQHVSSQPMTYSHHHALDIRQSPSKCELLTCDTNFPVITSYHIPISAIMSTYIRPGLELSGETVGCQLA